MENWIIALSNLPALAPLYLALVVHRDLLTTLCLALVATASFVSHLLENHKHGMPGAWPGISAASSIAWNRWDRLGVLLCCTRGAWLFWHKPPTLWLLASMLAASGLNLLSEWDKTPETRTFFIVTHSLWHVCIFTCIALYLSG
jgi:energy-converting hydrogenase Eha subunit G